MYADDDLVDDGIFALACGDILFIFIGSSCLDQYPTDDAVAEQVRADLNSGTLAGANVSREADLHCVREGRDDDEESMGAFFEAFADGLQ